MQNLRTYNEQQGEFIWEGMRKLCTYYNLSGLLATSTAVVPFRGIITDYFQALVSDPKNATWLGLCKIGVYKRVTFFAVYYLAYYGSLNIALSVQGIKRCLIAIYHLKKELAATKRRVVELTHQLAQAVIACQTAQAENNLLRQETEAKLLANQAKVEELERKVEILKQAVLDRDRRTAEVIALALRHQHPHTSLPSPVI